MSIPSRLLVAVLVTSALASPAMAYAQVADAQPATATPTTTPSTTPEQPAEQPVEQAAEQPEVSIPGGEIVVTGQRDRNVSKNSDQVISVLTTADIARTGEGNIAGALGRVTGLSVVGSGFVYVRGLGDRYSLAARPCRAPNRSSAWFRSICSPAA
jgi:outer membrane receptor protein involved in Fe transport